MYRRRVGFAEWQMMLLNADEAPWRVKPIRDIHSSIHCRSLRVRLMSDMTHYACAHDEYQAPPAAATVLLWKLIAAEMEWRLFWWSKYKTASTASVLRHWLHISWRRADVDRLYRTVQHSGCGLERIGKFLRTRSLQWLNCIIQTLRYVTHITSVLSAMLLFTAVWVWWMRSAENHFLRLSSEAIHCLYSNPG